MIEFGLPAGRDDGEHNGVGLVQVSEISTKRNEFVYGFPSFDGDFLVLSEGNHTDNPPQLLRGPLN